MSGLKKLILGAAVILLTHAFAEDESPKKEFAYPQDVRAFRAKALHVDGVFAPDIAFAIRTCPRCSRPYVYGNFPRLKREPWNDLASVHQMIESNILRRAAPRMMFSKRLGKAVSRSCPACAEPENGAKPDKILLCHVIPESGDDFQIEYEIRDKEIASKKYFLVPKDKDAQELALKDEKPETLRAALGHYFSLREVWNEMLANSSSADKPVVRNVAPGMAFVLRPRNVSKSDFEKYLETELKGYDRSESIVPSGPEAEMAGDDVSNWLSKENQELVATGRVECRVAISEKALQQAATEVVATHNIGLDVIAAEKPDSSPRAQLSRNQIKVDASLAVLGRRAAQAGISFHHASAYFLTAPVYLIDAADRLNEAIRAQRRQCTAEISDGRYLVLKDQKNEERKVDLQRLSDKLDPTEPLLFGLYVDMMLAWNPRDNCFGPKPNPRDVSPTGLPAFFEKRIRPVGHLALSNHPDALFEPREDADGKKYDLCYTSECNSSLTYVDPTKERFKGLTLEEVRKLYDSTAGLLPTYVDSMDTLELSGNLRQKIIPVSVALMCGSEVASLALDNSRATALSTSGGFPGSEGRLHVYAFSTNTVALSSRKLTDEEFKLVKSRMTDFVAETRTEPGLELGLHFDLPRTTPRGTVLRRR